jgi:hypothetical protein
MIRHGDLALIPLKRRVNGSGELLPENFVILEDSHLVYGAILCRVNGSLIVKNPCIRHLPGVHPETKIDGWFKVVVGKRAPFWKFAAPTID